jgi:hypothetical protein
MQSAVYQTLPYMIQKGGDIVFRTASPLSFSNFWLQLSSSRSTIKQNTQAYRYTFIYTKFLAKSLKPTNNKVTRY